MTVPLSPSQYDSPALDDGCSSVRVAVRARPLIEKEIVEKCKECVSYSQDGKQVVLGKDRRFTFDHVFGPIVSQEDVYIDCVKPLVESCCAGYNATVLAYGQTGSGKTFTMGCGNNASLLEEELGILPRAIRQLFECVEERSNQAEFLIKCAFVEIYNEEIKDLLHPDTPSRSISIREDANGDIVLAGVKEEVVTSFESMIRFLEHGSVFRTTGSTLMNQHSSRSHAIFTIIVEQRSIVECTNTNDVITAKFHLVDLAGSERAKRTGAVGMRFKESVTINCGLLALGNVISALGDERKRCQHVPYRESKLTRMLQDSLGGNSRTCMIACISTADTNFEETLNTLKYANRARNIRNNPVINRDPQSVMLNQLRQEIRALQVELLNLRMHNMGLETVSGPQSLEILLEDESHREFLADIRARADISVGMTAELNAVRRKSRESEQECLKLKDEIQLKLDEVNSEMMALKQVVPRWESCNDIGFAVKSHLSEMMKRVVGGIDDEGSGLASSESSFSSLDRPASADTAMRKFEKDLNPMTDWVTPRDSGLIDRPKTQPEDSQAVGSMRNLFSPSKADVKRVNCNSPNQANRGTRNIINQHLRTIRVLEERLAVKESDVKSKDEALKEATEDLARDERIFAEKMKEIKILKKLAQDLSNEKKTLMQKTEKDASIISRLSEEAMAKEDELGRLRTSIETLQTGRPDAFVMNGAGVPGLPVAVMNPKGKNDDCYSDNMENSDEAKGDVLDGSIDMGDTFDQACLSDLSEKLKVGDTKEGFLSEKIAFEEQKHLEEDERVQTREFKRNKQVMDKQLHELAFSIQQKEELIEELAKNESETKHLTVQYESRMLELEAEVHRHHLLLMKRKEEEVDSLKKELEAIDKNVVRGIEEKKKLREQYEEKVKKITAQLVSLKKQRWEQESQRLERQKAKSDVKVQQLQHEITRMRVQQDFLKEKIKETTEKYEDGHEMHQKNMVILKRESENQVKRARELEIENQRQSQVTSTKNEERSAANKKLELEILVMDSPIVGSQERTDQKSNSKRGRTALPGLAESPHVINVDRMESLLDQEIDKLLKMKEAKNSTNKLEAKKEEILSEKDDCVNERSKLELKHARAVHDITKKLEQKRVRIEMLEKNAQEKLGKAEEAKSAGKLALANELTEEVTLLHEDCAREKETCIKLEDFQSSQKLLKEAEELRDLDERIEGLDAQAEYVTSSIAEHERDILEGNITKEEMTAQLDTISPHDAKVMLGKYLEKFVGAIEKQRQEAKDMANLEVQLKEKKQALNEIERNSRLKQLEFDRRLTELQTHHARNVQYLLKQVETVSSDPLLKRPVNLITTTLADIHLQDSEFADDKDESTDKVVPGVAQNVVELGKVNVHDKSIKSKLQAERQIWESERASWEAREHSFLSKHEQLERDHQALKEELENTKSLMHKAGLGIRLPVSNVRELMEIDVDHRCSQLQLPSRREP
ncbi:uncharacterized protein [Physcomitrium patens]|uniref:uncharacterized protein isoform X4 n=1 Tax=Physcomitrium patens TaxID=3218 RepID=UPI000D17B7ED|nr:kinesin-like protein kif7 isoform X5 [Physcomitrium patens]|eukprot:XP_024371268.1 kinesin-like protein kif7 isoform X5 [Physcomitrella patens]